MDTVNLTARLHKVEKAAPATYWASRIIEELSYLLILSESKNGALDAAIAPGIALLQQRFDTDQAITPATVRELEALLAPLSAEAKSLTVICTANAHIDMNWMWGYQETVALTVDTIRTVLTLMEEYPDFVYSQPQASVYRILEEYAPELLEKVRQRVKEGRWEASVATWVECDKNMPSTEALSRQILYSKRYISKLLDVPKEQLDLDFSPDTFGHGAHVPEILRNGGVKYYYHCRGHQGPNLFRWRSPSGAEVIAFREPTWYNLTVEASMFRYVPRFCGENRVDTVLSIYGVGDHGGGPTRRDLERIRDMQTWPLFPTILHGSLRQFFLHMETYREQLPVVEGELNFVFTGCYTSQSRIKRANRYGEEKLWDAEALDVMAAAWNPDHRPASGPENSWRKVLFNQFHDILPGSGTVETREYAMGQFQDAMAWTETSSKRAMQSIAAMAAGGKKALPEVGVGIFSCDGEGYGVSHTGITGDRRWYMLFNPTDQPRRELTELMLWDWQHSPEHIAITNEKGERVPYQVLGTGKIFWGHDFCRILIPAEVPPMGYSVCCVSYAQPEQVQISVNREPRQDGFGDADLVLENEKLKAVFLRQTMQCIHLIHKETGRDLVDPQRPAGGFELVTEDPHHGMAAWRTGPAAKIQKLNEENAVMVTNVCRGPLRQSVSYYLCFGASRLDVTVSLDAGCDSLDYFVKLDWHALGGFPAGIPHLRFPVSVGYDHSTYRYLTAGGCVDRTAISYDVPTLGLGCAVAESGVSLAVLCDCKYGFRGDDGCLSVSLQRSPYEPDPCPDQGIHYIKLSLAAVSAEPAQLLGAASRQLHPVGACVVPLEGECQPASFSGSLFTLEGGSLAGIKRSEKGDGILLRIINPESRPAEVSCAFCADVKSAHLTDVQEETQLPLRPQGSTVRWRMQPNTLYSLVVALRQE
ncbi:MAG: alpha-mannosidase [Oscillospiraceae bacterium]|nr:alpha-mannosidase [Oscillospiraceae bacterium]